MRKNIYKMLKQDIKKPRIISQVSNILSKILLGINSQNEKEKSIKTLKQDIKKLMVTYQVSNSFITFCRDQFRKWE